MNYSIFGDGEQGSREARGKEQGSKGQGVGSREVGSREARGKEQGSSNSPLANLQDAVKCGYSLLYSNLVTTQPP